MATIRASFRFIIGMLFGAGTAISLSPAFAALTAKPDHTAPALMVSLVLLCGALCLFAPTVRRAFGRGFLTLGAAIFALPISALMLSGRAASEAIGSAAEGSETLTAVGAGLAGAAITGAAGFVGFTIGSLLLLIGLVLSLGGRREVIVVEPTRHRDRS